MRPLDLAIRLGVGLVTMSIFVAFLFIVEGKAKAVRKVPNAVSPIPVFRVARQSDVYSIYKERGLWGVRAVHLNQFLNMLEYLPPEERLSMPFPVQVKDIRPFYEKGLDSHNWLFIANRTGLVRTATIIMPDVVLLKRLDAFKEDFSFRISRGFVSGYSQDFPFVVTSLKVLQFTPEPVVVTVDAGFFSGGDDPEETASALRRAFPDIRIMTLVASFDEPEVTLDMRDKLKRFEIAFQAGGLQ